MNAFQWQQKAVDEVGSDGANAVYELRLPFGVTGGTFPLSVSGDSTEALAFNVSSSDMQTALEALPAVGPGNIAVNGPKKGPYYIELTGDNACQLIPDGWLMADGSSLEPPVQYLTPVLLQNGRATSLLARAEQLWDLYADKVDDFTRYLWVKQDLIYGELARFVGAVDGRNNDKEAKESQRFSHLQAMLAQTQAAINNRINDLASSDYGQTRTGKTSAAQRVEAAFAMLNGCRRGF